MTDDVGSCGPTKMYGEANGYRREPQFAVRTCARRAKPGAGEAVNLAATLASRKVYIR